MKKDIGKLEEGFKGEILHSVPMSEYTSFRVGGPVDCLVFPADVDDLRKVVHWCRRERVNYFILGNGTNLLVRDGGVRGLVLSLVRGFRELSVLQDGTEENVVFAGAGEPLGALLDFVCGRNLSGLEWSAGIPGSVGGALFMNAGAFGGEMKDRAVSVRFMDPEGVVLEKAREDLKFSYRSLALDKGWIILGGTFRLKTGKPEAIRARREEILQKRHARQPLNLPSAGSVFRNPGRSAAGRLIEEVGLKGTRIRNAQISDKHANFIVNLGQARARDILSLADWAREKVFQEKGVRLEMEIRVMGEDERPGNGNSKIEA